MKIEISQEERMILMLIDNKYKYIARDKDGSLFAFQNKPMKDYTSNAWTDNGGAFASLSAISRDLLSFITYEDKQPHKIRDLLGDIEIDG